nr:MAG TPA: putative tail fiber protein [Caudoviricetes sp.]
MSELDLNNIVGFKAVDAEGNEQQVTVDEMVNMVSAKMVMALSETSTFAAAAAAGTDEFEDQLPVSDTFSWLRTLDGSKNPTLTSSTAAAKVLGGLIGINNTWLRYRDVRSIESQDILDSMQYSGIYGLSEKSVLEYVRNCILIVAGNPGVICIQKLYNYDGSIYKYRVKWYGNNWGNWRNVYFV